MASQHPKSDAPVAADTSTNTASQNDPSQQGASHSAASETHHHHDLVRQPTREEKVAEAFAEGHDADIPSSLGYILDDRGEEKRRQSISRQRRASDARAPSHHEEREVDTETATERDNDVEKAGASGSADGGETSDEENVVWWDGPDDPKNPYNWPSWKKVVNCTLISAMTFVTPLASSVFAPGVPELMKEFQSQSPYLAAFVVSVYILGFAAGPLLIAPLSEIYGRRILYHVCNLFFVCFNVGCALAPSLNSLIGFRFLAGIFGSCPVTIGGGSIADMITQEKRAAAMGAFTIGPLLGPIIGPVAGGFLAESKGWRWTFWLLVIIGGFLSLVMIFLLEESYTPILLSRKVKKLRKESGNDLLRSKLDVGLSPADYFKRGIIRPLKMLAFSPITIIFGVYIAVVYGYLYLMFTSITTVFMEYYHFTTGTAGLAFMGLGVGSLIGVACFSVSSDRYIRKKAAQEDAAADAAGREREGMKPEYRLALLPVGGLLLPVGLFIYGWTAQYRVHWIVPILGTAVVGIGNLVIFMALQLYLVDAFTLYAASAIAANTVIRSVAGAVLPLAGLRMYQNLGVGWGNSVLGFIAAALIPLPFIIMRYGEYLRKNSEPKNL